jgi:hypothetical protein
MRSGVWQEKSEVALRTDADRAGIRLLLRSWLVMPDISFGQFSVDRNEKASGRDTRDCPLREHRRNQTIDH